MIWNILCKNDVILMSIYEKKVTMDLSHMMEVYESYDKGGDDWVDVLFKDYPMWDDKRVAPKYIYVFMNRIQEKKDPDHRSYVLDKVEDVFKIRFKDKSTVRGFYEQFSREQLIAVGI
uniref:Uncharacterized protein n=1 Tax=Pithovirus LCPAC403 TaxID=2506596 RepID=A0A481ZBC1_9VIRU|nr:MAG: uncharacterized protein LCPAC403_00700 [Pithovirus LCPAC403]